MEMWRKFIGRVFMENWSKEAKLNPLCAQIAMGSTALSPLLIPALRFQKHAWHKPPVPLAMNLLPWQKNTEPQLVSWYHLLTVIMD
jgi:hypothetical protein